MRVPSGEQLTGRLNKLNSKQPASPRPDKLSNAPSRVCYFRGIWITFELIFGSQD